MNPSRYSNISLCKSYDSGVKTQSSVLSIQIANEDDNNVVIQLFPKKRKSRRHERRRIRRSKQKRQSAGGNQCSCGFRNGRPVYCNNCNNIYRTTFGPTLDETVLVGLETVKNLCTDCDESLIAERGSDNDVEFPCRRGNIEEIYPRPFPPPAPIKMEPVPSYARKNESIKPAPSIARKNESMKPAPSIARKNETIVLHESGLCKCRPSKRTSRSIYVCLANRNKQKHGVCTDPNNANKYIICESILEANKKRVIDARILMANYESKQCPLYSSTNEKHIKSLPSAIRCTRTWSKPKQNSVNKSTNTNYSSTRSIGTSLKSLTTKSTDPPQENNIAPLQKTEYNQETNDKPQTEQTLENKSITIQNNVEIENGMPRSKSVEISKPVKFIKEVQKPSEVQDIKMSSIQSDLHQEGKRKRFTFFNNADIDTPDLNYDNNNVIYKVKKLTKTNLFHKTSLTCPISKKGNKCAECKCQSRHSLFSSSKKNNSSIREYRISRLSQDTVYKTSDANSILKECSLLDILDRPLNSSTSKNSSNKNSTSTSQHRLDSLQKSLISTISDETIPSYETDSSKFEEVSIHDNKKNTKCKNICPKFKKVSINDNKKSTKCCKDACQLTSKLDPTVYKCDDFTNTNFSNKNLTNPDGKNVTAEKRKSKIPRVFSRAFSSRSNKKVIKSEDPSKSIYTQKELDILNKYIDISEKDKMNQAFNPYKPPKEYTTGYFTVEQGPTNTNVSKITFDSDDSDELKLYRFSFNNHDRDDCTSSSESSSSMTNNNKNVSIMSICNQTAVQHDLKVTEENVSLRSPVPQWQRKQCFPTAYFLENQNYLNESKPKMSFRDDSTTITRSSYTSSSTWSSVEYEDEIIGLIKSRPSKSNTSTSTESCKNNVPTCSRSIPMNKNVTKSVTRTTSCRPINTKHLCPPIKVPTISCLKVKKKVSSAVVFPTEQTFLPCSIDIPKSPTKSRKPICFQCQYLSAGGISKTTYRRRTFLKSLQRSVDSNILPTEPGHDAAIKQNSQIFQDYAEFRDQYGNLDTISEDADNENYNKNSVMNPGNTQIYLQDIETGNYRNTTSTSPIRSLTNPEDPENMNYRTTTNTSTGNGKSLSNLLEAHKQSSPKLQSDNYDRGQVDYKIPSSINHPGSVKYSEVIETENYKHPASINPQDSMGYRNTLPKNNPNSKQYSKDMTNYKNPASMNYEQSIHLDLEGTAENMEKSHMKNLRQTTLSAQASANHNSSHSLHYGQSGSNSEEEIMRYHDHDSKFSTTDPQPFRNTAGTSKMSAKDPETLNYKPSVRYGTTRNTSNFSEENLEKSHMKNLGQTSLSAQAKASANPNSSHSLHYGQSGSNSEEEIMRYHDPKFSTTDPQPFRNTAGTSKMSAKASANHNSSHSLHYGQSGSNSEEEIMSHYDPKFSTTDPQPFRNASGTSKMSSKDPGMLNYKPSVHYGTNTSSFSEDANTNNLRNSPSTTNRENSDLYSEAVLDHFQHPASTVSSKNYANSDSYSEETGQLNYGHFRHSDDTKKENYSHSSVHRGHVSYIEDTPTTTISRETDHTGNDTTQFCFPELVPYCQSFYDPNNPVCVPGKPKGIYCKQRMCSPKCGSPPPSHDPPPLQPCEYEPEPELEAETSPPQSSPHMTLNINNINGKSSQSHNKNDATEDASMQGTMPLKNNNEFIMPSNQNNGSSLPPKQTNGCNMQSNENNGCNVPPKQTNGCIMHPPKSKLSRLTAENLGSICIKGTMSSNMPQESGCNNGSILTASPVGSRLCYSVDTQTDFRKEICRVFDYCTKDTSKSLDRVPFKCETVQKKSAMINTQPSLAEMPDVKFSRIPLTSEMICGGNKKRNILPNETRYAITRVTKYDDFTTYEVMKSTKLRPKFIPCTTEGVFIVKNKDKCCPQKMK